MHRGIHKRPGKQGDKWTTIVDLPRDPVTGKRRQKRITADTVREVERQAVALLHSIDTNRYINASNGTVREYLVRWLESIDGTVKSSTKQRYADLARLHITPIVGSHRLDKLSPLDVQTLYANRLSSGLSPSTVAMIHNVFHRALKQAVRWGLLLRNVTEMVDPPRETETDFNVWNQHEVARFFVFSDNDDLAALWRLAILTGMRRGEILGLKWPDIDLDRGNVSIRRTLSRGVGGSYVYGTPKKETWSPFHSPSGVSGRQSSRSSKASERAPAEGRCCVRE